MLRVAMSNGYRANWIGNKAIMSTDRMTLESNYFGRILRSFFWVFYKNIIWKFILQLNLISIHFHMALRTRFYGSRDQLSMKYRLKCDRHIWQTRKAWNFPYGNQTKVDVHLEIMQFLLRTRLKWKQIFRLVSRHTSACICCSKRSNACVSE